MVDLTTRVVRGSPARAGIDPSPAASIEALVPPQDAIKSLDGSPARAGIDLRRLDLIHPMVPPHARG